VTGIMTLPTGTVYISGGRSSIVGPPLASVTVNCINIYVAQHGSQLLTHQHVVDVLGESVAREVRREHHHCRTMRMIQS
jgi:hypothetical protein